jgi:hypothetical protein
VACRHPLWQDLLPTLTGKVLKILARGHADDGARFNAVMLRIILNPDCSSVNPTIVKLKNAMPELAI